MVARNIKLIELEYFIKKQLKWKLQKDFRDLNIVKEADLECCSYFYLRKYLKPDTTWQILTRRHSQRTGHYIDLLIFRKLKPRIAIEFKWNPRKISDKDRKSLRKAIKRLQVNKAYFVCAVRRTLAFEKINTKTKSEQYRLHEVIVKLDLSPEEKKSGSKREDYSSTLDLENPR
jgi:hypothetical protein